MRNGDSQYMGGVLAGVGAVLAVLVVALLLITGDPALLPLILTTLALLGVGVYLAQVRWSRAGLAPSYLSALGAIATGVYAMATGAGWSVAGIDVVWDVVIAVGLVIYISILWWRTERRSPKRGHMTIGGQV